MALERALDGELCRLFLNHLGVGLDLAPLWELSRGGSQPSDFDVFEESIASTIGVNSCKLDLLLVLAHENLDAVGPSPLRNGNLQLLHKHFDDFIHSFVNHELGSLVYLGLLEVYHDEIASIGDAGERHHARWVDPHARAHRNSQVRDTVQSEAFHQDLSFEVLAEVDNRILKLTAAARGVTNAASQVSLVANRDLVVAHMLSVTLHAHFKVRVSVELSHHVSVDTTLAVKAIDVLADDTLEDVAILELYQRHVRL